MSVKKHKKLSQFLATAICGNDILSSALYVSGIAAIFAGVYAPLVLLAVGVVLLLYKSVYREVVEALPVNGGAYNALLNSTTKLAAATAGTMTILSYIATAVISAKTAVEYFLQFAKKYLELNPTFLPNLNLENYVLPATVVVLLFFAVLVIMGVKDSAKVAAAIFTIHVLALTTFVGIGIYFFITHGAGQFLNNIPDTKNIIANHNNIFNTLFLAFSVSLLGVSGFESSANFVEEQERGVFRKTLRNMALSVMIFNPLIALICLNSASIPQITEAKDFLLAAVSYSLGGMPLLAFIATDAFLVLCGAVLTGYVGVSGLIQRMSLDSALPQFLAKKNNKGSFPRIILTFFVLCVSILFLTRGNLLSLAGVYTISFLSVMTLFAVGNLILRATRKELKRPYKAPILIVILALLSTTVGLLGNIAIDLKNVIFFLIYFIPAIIIVFSIIFKKEVMQSVQKIFSFIPPLHKFLQKQIDRISGNHYYIFLHHTTNIFRALDYINSNEGGNRVTFVHCQKNSDEVGRNIKLLLPYLQKAGVFPHMTVDFASIPKKFGPRTVTDFITKRKTSSSKIFMGSIHHFHDFEYSDFGGVRIILE